MTLHMTQYKYSCPNRIHQFVLDGDIERCIYCFPKGDIVKELTLRQQLPELNDAQWQLLECTLLAVLPPKYRPEYDKHIDSYQYGFNDLHDQATDSIRKALAK